MGALVESVHETTGRAATAWMFAQRRQRFDETVAEPGHIYRGELLSSPSVTSQAITGAKPPIIRSA